MRILSLAVLTATLSAAVVSAAPNDQAIPGRTQISVSDSASSPSNTIIESIAAPTFGPMKLSAGYKSQNTGGRTGELADEKGRRYKMKNEFYAGLTHSSGWGVTAMGVQSGESFADETRSHFAAGDPSVTLAHPALYQNEDLKVTGQFRKYFAESARSLDRNQNQYAYYLFATYALGKGVNLFNQLTPRYFAQSYYKDTDTTHYVEDFTTIAKTQNSWFKYGLGQHSQFEWHNKTTNGTVTEIYPFVDVVLSRNIFVEPRFYLPVYRTGGAVYDAPKSVSLDQTQAELFVQVSI